MDRASHQADDRPTDATTSGVAARTTGMTSAEHYAASHRFAMIGMLLGAAVAIVLLAAVSVVLLRAEGSTYKVLVAPWLWLLPALGVFSGAGYLLGKGADAIAASEMDR